MEMLMTFFRLSSSNSCFLEVWLLSFFSHLTSGISECSGFILKHIGCIRNSAFMPQNCFPFQPDLVWIQKRSLSPAFETFTAVVSHRRSFICCSKRNTWRNYHSDKSSYVTVTTALSEAGWPSNTSAQSVQQVISETWNQTPHDYYKSYLRKATAIKRYKKKSNND